MRLKLHFQRGIVPDNLRKSWFVPTIPQVDAHEELSSILQLKQAIIQAFDLRISPMDLSLLLEGYTLSDGQPLSILKENECISIKSQNTLSPTPKNSSPSLKRRRENSEIFAFFASLMKTMSRKFIRVLPTKEKAKLYFSKKKFVKRLQSSSQSMNHILDPSDSSTAQLSSSSASHAFSKYDKRVNHSPESSFVINQQDSRNVPYCQDLNFNRSEKTKSIMNHNISLSPSASAPVMHSTAKTSNYHSANNKLTEPSQHIRFNEKEDNSDHPFASEDQFMNVFEDQHHSILSSGLNIGTDCLSEIPNVVFSTAKLYSDIPYRSVVTLTKSQRKRQKRKSKKQEKNMTELSTKDYSQFPVIHDQPMPNQKIAFRTMELSADYTPQLSEYKEGSVVSFDGAKQEITLVLEENFQIIDSNPHGKFSLKNNDDSQEDQNNGSPVNHQLTLAYEKLSDVRIISSENPIE